ncbi:MAG: WG repeat-containing protein [Marinoscillum sp.]
MKSSHLIILALSLVNIFSCQQKMETDHAVFEYHDKSVMDTTANTILIAVTDEDYLQYGSRVAYLNESGDTIIPLDRYAYLGTDTLRHYANVIEYPMDSSYGRWIAIDENQNVLYEIVPFDNGPDYFNEGWVRAKRNDKMGFANEYGQVVIACEYDFAWWFEDGRAKVTFDAREIKDGDHTRIESDAWFYIDNKGNRIE